MQTALRRTKATTRTKPTHQIFFEMLENEVPYVHSVKKTLMPRPKRVDPENLETTRC